MKNVIETFSFVSWKKMAYFQYFETCDENLGFLDSISKRISRGFNFANGQILKFSRGLIFAIPPKNSRNREILSTRNFIHLRYPRNCVFWNLIFWFLNMNYNWFPQGKSAKIKVFQNYQNTVYKKLSEKLRNIYYLHCK